MPLEYSLQVGITNIIVCKLVPTINEKITIKLTWGFWLVASYIFLYVWAMPAILRPLTNAKIMLYRRPFLVHFFGHYLLHQTPPLKMAFTSL